MNPQKKKQYIIGGSIAVVIIVLLIIFWSLGWFHGGAKPSSTPPAALNSGPAGPITQATLSRSAYDTALTRAQQWEADAVLIKMESADSTGNDWNFTFVSPTNKGKGFVVTVDGSSVANAEEVPFAGTGNPLPTNIVSPDAALAEVRAMSGNGNTTINAMTMIYNTGAHQWYWGLQLSTGFTETIKATP